MSDLLRSLAAGAKALATGNVNALTGFNSEEARYEYNREQARRARGAGSGANGFAGRETPDEYNQRLAAEMLGFRSPTALIPPDPPPPKPKPFASSWGRSPTGPTGYDS